MKKKQYSIIFLCFFLFLLSSSISSTIFSIKNNSDVEKKIQFTISLPKDIYIINNSIQVYQNKTLLPITIHNCENGKIIFGKDIFDVIYPTQDTTVNIDTPNIPEKITIHYTIFNSITNDTKTMENVIEIKKPKSFSFTSIASFFTNLPNQLQNQNSALLILIIFLLGILMSLTPCIYPMIPITISLLGIDQKSFGQRLYAGCLYMAGIGITFSILGLLSASGTIVFGSITSHPVFIIISSIILLIMALSMLGLTPSFLNLSITIKLPHWIEQSSFLPFFYGIASGTITSPCVSPGLLGLLTLASQQNNLFIAWLWLFIFGCGLAFPLFCIALISNTALRLPGSGTWMNTLKEFLGIILLFVIHKNIIMVSNFIVSSIIISIIFIVYIIYKIYNNINILYHVFFATLIFSSILFMLHKNKSIQTVETNDHNKTEWHYNINNAIADAKQNSKLLLVDFGAEWCSSCVEIEKKLLHKQSFTSKISNIVTLCKIDCTKPEATTQALMKQYQIRGLPTILLLNPNKQEIIKKYDSSLFGIEETVLIQEIQHIHNNIYTKINHET